MAKEIIPLILCITLLCGCSNTMWGLRENTHEAKPSAQIYTDSEKDEYLNGLYNLVYDSVRYTPENGEDYYVLEPGNDKSVKLSEKEYNDLIHKYVSSFEKTDMYFTRRYTDPEPIKTYVYYNRDNDLILPYFEDMHLIASSLCNFSRHIAKGYEDFIENIRSSTDFIYNDGNAGGRYTRLDFSNKEYALIRDMYSSISSDSLHISHLPARVSLYFDGDKCVKAYVSFMKVNSLDTKMDEATIKSLSAILKAAGFEDAESIINSVSESIEYNEIRTAPDKYELTFYDTSEPQSYYNEDLLAGKGVIVIK